MLLQQALRMHLAEAESKSLVLSRLFLFPVSHHLTLTQHDYTHLCGL